MKALRIVPLVIMFLVMLVTFMSPRSESTSAQPYPDFLEFGNAQLFAYPSQVRENHWDRNIKPWDGLESNIQALDTAIELLPEAMQSIAQGCGAEWVQVDVDYINIFCPYFVATDQPLNGPTLLENGLVRQRAIDVLNGIDGAYLETDYGPAVSLEMFDGRQIEIGMPTPGLSPYPNLGDVPNGVMHVVRGGPELFWEDVANYFSEVLNTSVRVENLRFLYDDNLVFAFEVAHLGQFWYYPMGYRGNSILNQLAEAQSIEWNRARPTASTFEVVWSNTQLSGAAEE